MDAMTPEDALITLKSGLARSLAEQMKYDSGVDRDWRMKLEKVQTHMLQYLLVSIPALFQSTYLMQHLVIFSCAEVRTMPLMSIFYVLLSSPLS
jgi:hypothetical protein